MKKNEDILKHLIEKTELEKPSEDFTQRVISSLNIQTEEKRSFAFIPDIGWKYWVLIGLALVTLVFFVFFVDFSFFQNYFNFSNAGKVLGYSSGLFESFKQLFSGINISSISIIIIASLIGLVVLDRVLRKTFSVNLFTL